ncbi:PQQ-binding-like beta-propeller repeat protein [Streptomyces sp. NPDC005423]|uniref:outer membrane protein assembly factor BamB family protein n=1 Tax=Streptomyces sp. NPDC005423 TaxID=3155343 RepID=UPI0033A20B4A
MTKTTRLLGEPDPAARRQVMAVLVTLVVVMSVGRAIQWYTERDVVTGSRGPFPAALGTEAPIAPSRVAHHPQRPAALVHGLFIDPTGSGVRALNYRTGKEYWRYERHDEGADDPAVEASADTVVAWFGDGTLVGIDLRTGNVRWRADSAPDGFQQVHVGAGRVVAQSPGGVTAFSERSGAELWQLKPPRSCGDPTPWTVVDLPQHLTAVELGCASPDDQDGVVVGVDNRTGTQLWKRGVRQELHRADDHTLVAVAPHTSGERGEKDRVQVLDVDRKGATVRTAFTSGSWSPDDAGDGVIVSSANPGAPESGDATVLTGYDTRVGKRVWERRVLAGCSFGTAKLADGRVYVVQNATIPGGNTGRVLDADLLVLDGRSGRLLHTLRLPDLTVPRDVDLPDLSVHRVSDGVVDLGWPEADDVLTVT